MKEKGINNDNIEMNVKKYLLPTFLLKREQLPSVL